MEMLVEETSLKLDYNIGVFTDTLYRVIAKDPRGPFYHRLHDFCKSFSDNQHICKIWLCEELRKILDAKKDHYTAKKVMILGSWYGNIIVPLLINNFPEIEEINLVDMDEDALAISRKFMQHYRDQIKISWTHDDVNFMRFDNLYTNICINTSCEHMYPMSSVHFENDEDVIYALQTNNMKDIREHVSCVESAKEFVKQAELKRTYFEGKKQLYKAGGKEKYERYLIIGKRS